MSYQTTTEQLLATRRLMRLAGVAMEAALAGLDAVEREASDERDLLDHGPDPDIGEPINRAVVIVREGREEVARAFRGLIDRLSNWTPDHGHRLRNARPGDNAMPQ